MARGSDLWCPGTEGNTSKGEMRLGEAVLGACEVPFWGFSFLSERGRRACREMLAAEEERAQKQWAAQERLHARALGDQVKG